MTAGRLEPDKIMAEHPEMRNAGWAPYCETCDGLDWPCEPYLQAKDRKRLTAEVKTLRAERERLVIAEGYDSARDCLVIVVDRSQPTVHDAATCPFDCDGQREADWAALGGDQQ